MYIMYNMAESSDDACSDEPPRSFKLLMALYTISAVGGCAGFTRGFFAAADAAEALAFLAAGDAAATGAATSASATVSAIICVRVWRFAGRTFFTKQISIIAPNVVTLVYRKPQHLGESIRKVSPCTTSPSELANSQGWDIQWYRFARIQLIMPSSTMPPL